MKRKMFILSLVLTGLFHAPLIFSQEETDDFLLTEEDKKEIEISPKEWLAKNSHLPGKKDQFRAYRVRLVFLQNKKLREKKSVSRDMVNCSSLKENHSQQVMEDEEVDQAYLKFIKQKEKEAERNKRYYPQLFEELIKNDADVLVLIIGAGFRKDHQRPQHLLNLYGYPHKKIKVINLDPLLVDEENIVDQNLKIFFYPIFFPGHDGSGFAPNKTIYDDMAKLKLEVAARKATRDDKKVVLISSASYYPLDSFIHVWKRYKNQGSVELIQHYAQTPVMLFHRTEEASFPSYQQMVEYMEELYSTKKVDTESEEILGPLQTMVRSLAEILSFTEKKSQVVEAKKWAKIFSHLEEITSEDLNLR